MILKVGDVVTGVVNKITAFGFIVKISDKHEAFLKNEELYSGPKSSYVAQSLQRGDHVKAVVSDISDDQIYVSIQKYLNSESISLSEIFDLQSKSRNWLRLESSSLNPKVYALCSDIKKALSAQHVIIFRVDSKQKVFVYSRSEMETNSYRTPLTELFNDHIHLVIKTEQLTVADLTDRDEMSDLYKQLGCKSIVASPIPSEEFEDRYILILTFAQHGIFDQTQVPIIKGFSYQISAAIYRLETHRINSKEIRFANGILQSAFAHEIKNELGYLDVVLVGIEYKRFDKRSRRDIGKIRQALERIQNKLEVWFHDFSYDNKTALVNINESVRETVKLLDSLTQHRQIKIELELDDLLPDILLNSNEIRTALLNISINRVNAMTATKDQKKLLIKTMYEKDSQYPIKVYFLNRGSGINFANWNKIFEPYFDIDGTNSGLSLFISKEILSGFGGHVFVAESYILAGTCIALLLPEQQ